MELAHGTSLDLWAVLEGACDIIYLGLFPSLVINPVERMVMMGLHVCIINDQTPVAAYAPYIFKPKLFVPRALAHGDLIKSGPTLMTYVDNDTPKFGAGAFCISIGTLCRLVRDPVFFL